MADEDIKELKGFKKASVYRGQKINDDYLKRVLGMTMDDLNKKALSEGFGIFGKDANTTKMLNEMLAEVGEKPYETRNPILRKIEVDLFSSDLGKSKMERMVFNTRLEKISNAVQSMKGSLDDKVSYIRNTVKQFYPGISKASLKELPKIFSAALGLPISAGLSLAFSPSAEAAEMPKESIKDQVMKNMDFSAPSASSQLLEQLSQDSTMIKKAGGGMATMNEMIRPIGMAAGGPIPPEEPKIKPKEKPVNFKAIMAEFDTPEAKAGQKEPVGFSKILADLFPVDPINKFKDEQFKPLLKTIMKSSPTLSATEGIANLLMKEAGAAEIKDLSSLTDNQLLNNYISDMNFFILEGGDPKLLPDYIQKQRNELVSRGVID